MSFFSKPRQVSLCLVAIFLFIIHPEADSQPTYRVTQIGGLGGYVSGQALYQNSWARALNDKGVVIGYGWSPQGVQGFSWTSSSGPLALDFFDNRFHPYPQSYPLGINNIDNSTGWSSTNAGVRATGWIDGSGVINIGDLPSAGYPTDYSYSTGINDSNEIVGYGVVGNKAVAFTWSASQGTSVVAENVISTGGINSFGQFVGNRYPSGASNSAFIFDPIVGMMEMETRNSTVRLTSAVDINDLAQVIGQAYNSTNKVTTGYIWDSANGLRDLGRLNSSLNEIFPKAINGRGQVVGANSKDAMVYSRAFVWSEDLGMLDLNNLIEIEDNTFQGLVLREATDINIYGQIIANGYFNGAYSPFLLTPVPELPPSFMFLSAFVLFVANRRRFTST